MDEIVTVERRTRTLTDEDISAIIAAMRHNCPNGMTSEDAIELRAFANWLRSLRNAIGKVVIYGFLAFLAFLFYLGTGRIKG